MKKYRIETKGGAFCGVIEGKRAFKGWLEDRRKTNPACEWKEENYVLKEVKQTHKTEYTLFDSYDTCSKENMKEAEDSLIENMFWDADENGLVTVTDNYGKEVKISREEYAKTITEQKIYDECYFMEQTWFEDSRAELKRVDEGYGLVALADLGLWNGRRYGYKEVKELKDIMYTSCDYERVYVDSNGDLRKEESHHDGSNSILYRYWKEGLTEEQKENFLDKVYSGKCTQKDITRYTRKAGLGIADAFGWTVRGGENKYKKVA